MSEAEVVGKELSHGDDGDERQRPRRTPLFGKQRDRERDQRRHERRREDEPDGFRRRQRQHAERGDQHGEPGQVFEAPVGIGHAVERFRAQRADGCPPVHLEVAQFVGQMVEAEREKGGDCGQRAAPQQDGTRGRSLAG